MVRNPASRRAARCQAAYALYRTSDYRKTDVGSHVDCAETVVLFSWAHRVHSRGWDNSLVERAHPGAPVLYRTVNPCDRRGGVLGPQLDLVQHMRALPHGEVAAAIQAMWASGATPVVKLAFEFLVLTPARSGEVRGARCAEIDLPARVWTIPAVRMKSKRAHRVPLCRRAAEILEAARTLGDGRSPFVFASQGGKPFSITRLPRLLQNLKITAVPHGFRSSFRDWAAEETNHPREVVEAALAHVVGNRTEAAYARSDLFERRRRVMDDWATYLGGGAGR